MNPEFAKKLLEDVCLPAGAATLGFAAKGVIEWCQGNDGGKLSFFFGAAGFIFVLILATFLYFKAYPPAKENEYNGRGKIEIDDKRVRRRFCLSLVVSFLIFIGIAFLGPIAYLTTKDDTPPPNDGGDGSPENIDVPKTDKTAAEEPFQVKPYKGGVYTGTIDVKTGLPDGEGVLLFYEGGQYDGSWKDGQYHGHGIFVYKNGDRYDGDWKNGKRDGEGTYIWKDGQQYIGSYANDLRDGQGDYIGWTGYVDAYGWKGDYSGESRGNYFEGQGRFTFTNGDQFEGDFHANQFWNGTYTYDNGEKYQIVNGSPSH